jgi:NADH:ubiquinone oxidoreductase subunit 6 (subunit J)
MWQIMWLLSLLPNWFWHVMLGVTLITIAATYFLRMIPFLAVNAIQLRFVATILLILTVWMEGGIANEDKWQARVAELETKVAAAEKAAVEANGRIETVYVDRVRVVKEVQYVVQNRIAKDAARIDQTCRVDPEAIEILNQAAHAGDKK